MQANEENQVNQSFFKVKEIINAVLKKKWKRRTASPKSGQSHSQKVLKKQTNIRGPGGEINK